MHLSGLGVAARGHSGDYLNPTTWTGDCSFFFPDGLIPVHSLDFRSVDEALELFVADVATPPNDLFIHPRASALPQRYQISGPSFTYCIARASNASKPCCTTWYRGNGPKIPLNSGVCYGTIDAVLG